MTDKKPASTNANDINKTNTQKSEVAEQEPVKKIVEKSNVDKKTAAANTENKKEKTQKPPRKMDNRSIGSRSKSKVILWLAIVAIVFVVISYGVWQFWLIQNIRIQQSSEVSQQQYDGLLTTVNEKNAQLQQQLSDQQDQFSLLVQQSSKEQQLQQQRLDAQLAKINTLTGVSRDGWKLEEARHLLRLANQRQLTGSNVSGIVGLLEAADSVLREIDIPELFIIREKIQNDLLALKIAPAVDREGIYLQLNALINQAKNLPAAPRALPLEEKSDNNVAVNALSDTYNDAEQANLNLWEAIVQRAHYTFGSLDRYVRITHHDRPIEPVLSMAQQAITQENLRLLLAQAQVALLREESVIYQQSITRAIELLDQYYAHYPEKSLMVVMLQKLQEQKIETQLPNVASSLTLLSQYIDTQPSNVVPIKNTTPVPDSKAPEVITSDNVKEAAK
ncbi:MAG: uroporphyrin-3 C-methyltransferase [Granulosicoccus sp.]|jgi:uroporphyrin-3 C-methyltransferase